MSATTSPAVQEQHHLSGFWLSDVLGVLEQRIGEDAVRALLADVGEQRSVEALHDVSTWTSHERFHAIVHAAADALGGVEALASYRDVLMDGELPIGYVEAMQAQGSVDAIFATMSEVGSSIATTFRYASENVDDCEWIVRMSTVPGHEPFAEMCALNVAEFRRFPKLFGYTDVDVVEEQCQAKGAPECVFRARWSAPSEAAREAGFQELRTRVLEARIGRLNDLVADLAGDDSHETLRKVVDEFSHAAVAPVAMLVARDPRTARQTIVAIGADDAEAARLAAEIDAGLRADDPTVHVVPVESSRALHGYLAAAHSGVSDEQVEKLGVHARVAAVALDLIAARDEVRRQAHAAESLVELSTALSDIVSPGETAAKLARATPAIINCDRALVFLPEGPGDKPLLSAAHGYDDDTLARIRASLYGHAITEEITARGQIDDCLAECGVEDAIVEAIGSPNGPIGWICAGGGEAAGGPRWRTDARARLRGVAAQAATAIGNSHLLEQIRHQALHDGLTGLPNRSLIHDRLAQMLARARRNHVPVSVLFLDLDGFKEVNDTYGHDAGDELLRAVAVRLSATVRESDVVGRLGGDEFVVISEGAAHDEDPGLIAERIITVLREPYDIASAKEQGIVTIGASVGIARGDHQSPSEMLRDADLALYEAKRTGKGRFVRFEAEMHTAAHEQALLERDLRRALADDCFELVYQPIFDLSDELVTGVEALLRWNDPARGLVLPDVFIPTLESTGMIVEVGRWVLDEACRQGAQWHEQGFAVNLSVNLSARQLDSDAIVGVVRGALDASGLAPESLILEVTESSIMRDTDAAVARLDALKAIGVKIAIDDFGTGYSSLAYLQQFPVDAIKIDRSFISAMSENAEASAIIRALIDLGKTLGLETLAEGIEQQDQRRQLEEVDCDSGQGFLFARPLAVGRMEQLLEQYAASSPSNR